MSFGEENCENCNMKKKHISKGVVVNPILSKEFNSRGQVDLIDFQSNPDGKYKCVMVYQDHLTKFCNIKPLTSKKASEVVFNLIDVFTIFFFFFNNNIFLFKMLVTFLLQKPKLLMKYFILIFSYIIKILSNNII
jgi:hypothetical protein